jgi:energy-coupling factor transport system ATP-binding protein
VITLTEAGYEYEDGTRALCDVSVELQSGELTAIVGPNGSGKSTLAKLVTGLLLPTRGSVAVDGHDTRTSRPEEIRRLVSLAWQNPDNQLVCGVVEDDIAFGPENLGLRPGEVRRRIEETLDRLDLAHLRSASIHRLSSAQKQLVAVAGAMAIEARYLILDEVTSRLDPASSHLLLDALTAWARERGCGIVMITHVMSEVLRADGVCRLERTGEDGGRLAAVGTPDRILRDAKLSDSITMETPLFDTLYRLDRLGVHLNGRPDTIDGLVELLCS